MATRREWIGFDAGATPLEDALAGAARHDCLLAAREMLTHILS